MNVKIALQGDRYYLGPREVCERYSVSAHDCQD